MQKLRLFLVGLLLSFVNPCLKAQSSSSYFTVIIQNGRVILESTQAALSIGQEIKPTDKIKCLDATAQLGLIDEEANRFSLKIDSSQLHNFYPITILLIPGKKENVTMDSKITIETIDGVGQSKGGALNDLKIHISGSEDKEEAQDFVILDQRRFFVKGLPPAFQLIVICSGASPKNIRIPTRGSIVNITRDFISKIGKCPHQEIRFYYLGRADLGLFKPKLVDQDRLFKQMQILIKRAKKRYPKPLDVFNKVLHPFVEEYYGLIDPYSLATWLNKRLTLGLAISN